MTAQNPGLIGRRRFLRQSALTGAGLVVGPAFLAACSTGATAPTAAPATAAPATAAPATAPAATAAPALTPNPGTTLKDFVPFAPSDKKGTPSPLPHSFAYTIPAPNEYFQGLSDAAKLAAKDRGIDYQGFVISDGDPVKNIDLMNQLLQKGIGGIWIQPEDSQAQAVVIKKAIAQGIMIMFSGHPATIQAMADQYDLGYQQALGAVQYIKDKLGGKATVGNMILDHIEILIPRHQGTLDALKTGGPGITVIEQELQKITSDEGFTFASTLLQAHPEINVWLGPDDTMLGVDAYLKSKGRDPAKDPTLLSGLAGTQAGLDALTSGKSFFRHSYGFNNNLIGYAVGQYMADWFEGKDIPQLLQGRVIPMTKPEDVPAFIALTKDVVSSWKKFSGGDYDTQGLAAWGSINYDTRDTFTINAVT
jgi:ribose transport system substrate-binding protein